jgi:chromosome segregation ATPase
LTLVERIDSHIEKSEQQSQSVVQPEPFSPSELEAKFSELIAVLDKKGAESEQISALYETQGKLREQLHTSENALVVSQCQIADRNAREELLKQKNVDLETTLQAYHIRGFENDNAIARNEELKVQMALLQENLNGSATRIENLEHELAKTTEELEQKVQAIQEVTEKLNHAEATTACSREAIEADFEEKCEQLSRGASKDKTGELANEIEYLGARLLQETEAKIVAEKEVDGLRTSLAGLKEKEAQMVGLPLTQLDGTDIPEAFISRKGRVATKELRDSGMLAFFVITSET